jgi:hypothetical protein
MPGRPKRRGGAPPAGSGVQEDGSFEPEFQGQREPFTKGNGLALTHGAKADLHLAPRAGELADGLREIVPARGEADEPTIQLAGLVLARVEAANRWLAERGIFQDERGVPQPVIKALSTWENTAARLLDRLGCTPASRAAIGLDLVRTSVAAQEHVDLSALSVEDLAQLRGILARAGGSDVIEENTVIKENSGDA